jgi:hypothetical protein
MAQNFEPSLNRDARPSDERSGFSEHLQVSKTKDAGV